MPSPFPGMDPYLEDSALWPDVHQTLIAYMREALQPVIRPRYFARLEERLIIDSDEPQRGVRPDVTITAGPERQPAQSATAVADEPVIMAMPEDETRHGYIEIIEAGGDRRVVTVIELLSPSNKRGFGPTWEDFRAKQGEFLRGPVHYIQIDLLRDGLWSFWFDRRGLKKGQFDPYLVAVRRRGDDDRTEGYPFALARPLPRIGVPLLPPDPDVVLDMQAVFTRTYDAAAYGDVIDYTEPPPVPLPPGEAAWMDALLREKGMR